MTTKLKLSDIDDSFVSERDREELGISIRILCPDGTSEIHDLDLAGSDYIDYVADRAIDADDAVRLAQLTPEQQKLYRATSYTDEECRLNHPECEDDWCQWEEDGNASYLHRETPRGIIVDWQWFAGAMPLGPPGSGVPTPDNRYVDAWSGSLATEIEASRHEW